MIPFFRMYGLIFGFLLVLSTIFIGTVWLLKQNQIFSSQSATVIQTDPLAGLSDFELGQYYFNHDDDPAGPYDLRKARYYYENAIRASSTANQLQWYQLGRIDFIEGKFNAAIHKFERQIELFNDEVSNVYYMLGLTYAYLASATENREHWREAEWAFNLYMNIYARKAWAPRVDLAWIYFAQGKYAPMKPILETGLEYEPNNPWLLNMLGLAYLNTNDPERALTLFTEAKTYAELLTTTDWGNAYPGNNPADWPTGLTEFKTLIEKNRTLAETQVTG